MDKNAVDEFLNGATDTDESTQDPFKSETDPFAEQSVEDKGDKSVGDDNLADEKPLPYHQDPKIQRFIEKEISKRLEKVTPPQTETRKFVEDTADDADDLMIRIFGNDTPEKVAISKEFKRYIAQTKDQAVASAIDTLKQQQKVEAEEQARAQDELKQGFENIEDSFGVDLSSGTATARKTRNEFIDFIKRVAPKDENGEISQYPDLKETFSLFQDMKKTPNQTTAKAKGLASRSMSRPNESVQKPEIKGNSWREVEQYINSIT